MSVQRAHGHERKRASKPNVTSSEPITLEQFKRGATNEVDALLPLPTCDRCGWRGIHHPKCIGPRS